LEDWKEHVDRMSSDRIPKMILKYQPKGKRNLGRPLKRWKDSVLLTPVTGLNRPIAGKEDDYIYIYIVTYQGSPVTQQLNGASLLYSLISATMKTNASS
jgi:hypothetical protein